jgi:hypothetical protein
MLLDCSKKKKKKKRTVKFGRLLTQKGKQQPVAQAASNTCADHAE